jgi:hypothetical protein
MQPKIAAAGIPLRWWEDPDLGALKKVAAAHPEVMQSQVPTADEAEALSDSHFALVDKTAGLRLFPTNTDAATLVSAELYKVAAPHFVPEMRERIELRFKLAADWHGIPLPDFWGQEKTSAPQDDSYAIKIASADGDISRYYALSSPALVKTAADYFEVHHRSLAPEHRQAFSTNVVKRAAEFGMVLDGGSALRKYASPVVRGDAGNYVRASRIPGLSTQEKTAEAYGYPAALAEKERVSEAYHKLAHMLDTGAIGLDDAVAGLTYIDKNAGRPVGKQWDELATGEKVAFGFSQEVGGEQVSGDMLKKIDAPSIAAHFGQAFAKVFAERPVEVFASLPDDQQEIVKEIAYGRA